MITSFVIKVELSNNNNNFACFLKEFIMVPIFVIVFTLIKMFRVLFAAINLPRLIKKSNLADLAKIKQMIEE